MERRKKKQQQASKKNVVEITEVVLCENGINKTGTTGDFFTPDRPQQNRPSAVVEMY